MSRLLFLAHRIPFPPNKGDKIRSWNFLARLAETYEVHVAAFVDDPHDWRYTSEIENIAASTCFLPLNKRVALARSLAGFLTGKPLTVGYYRDRKMRKWVDELAAAQPIDRVFVYSSSMIQYVPGKLAPGARTVIDFVDVDSDKWRQYAEKKSWPQSWVYGREARTLLEVERKGAVAADAAAFVSEDEAALFRKLAPEAAATTEGIPNGVDLDHFDPAADMPAPPFDPAGANVVFTGAMDYWANVDAVTWFADEVFPAVRRAVPGATFWIVGANPAPDVEKLGRRDGIEVTGRVEDIRPYIAHAAVSVAPLRVARGIQNKVLEAMAMERPTVATPEAIEGIRAEHGTEVVVAGDAADFAEQVRVLLVEPDRRAIGKAARVRVAESHGWPASLQTLVSVLEGKTAA